jgi:hypothetical protein
VRGESWQRATGGAGEEEARGPMESAEGACFSGSGPNKLVAGMGSRALAIAARGGSGSDGGGGDGGGGGGGGAGSQASGRWSWMFFINGDDSSSWGAGHRRSDAGIAFPPYSTELASHSLWCVLSPPPSPSMSLSW